MKSTKNIACILVITHLLTACAVAPDRIQPHYVSPNMYQSYTCDQLSEEIDRIDSATERLSDEQQSAADTDDVLTFVGVVLFWPALLFLAGTDDHEHSVAQIKGEQRASHEQWESKGCEKPVLAEPAT